MTETEIPREHHKPERRRAGSVVVVNTGDGKGTVTEMRKVKHAYDTGVLAKKGIDC